MDDKIGDPFGLFDVLAINPSALGNIIEANCVARGIPHARKGDEIAVVEVPIGKRDQWFSLRTVVPSQAFTWHVDRLAQRQNAFEVPDVVFFIRFCIGATEEVCRRQLLLISGHDGLAAAVNSPDCIPGKHL